MLFGPILENSFEVWTYFIGFLQDFLGLFVQVKFNTVADDHQVQNQTLILGLVIGVHHNVFYRFRVIGNEFFLDVPMGGLDEVGKKDDFDLIEEKYFTDGLDNLKNGVFGAVSTGLGDAVEEWIYPFHIVFGVVVKTFTIGRCNVVYLLLLFYHFIDRVGLIKSLETKSGQVLS